MPGVFLGYAQQAGGGWNGDLLVADWEALANATSLTDFPIKRFRHKEVTPVKDGELFKFPAAEARASQPLELRGSDPFNGSSSAPSAEAVDDDSSPMAVGDQDEVKVDPDMPAGEGSEEQDFWSFNGDTLVCHHIVPRSTLFTPSDSNCPLPEIGRAHVRTPVTA